MLRRLQFSFLLIFACLSTQPALAAAPKEYLVKAAFLYNFVKFIEWPGAQAIAKQSNVNICIIGASEMATAATAVFSEASTPTLKFNVVSEQGWKGNGTACHMIFLSRSEEGKLPEVVSTLKSKPVLTVSDIDEFATRGGMIGFATSDGKIRLVVNSANIAASGLRVDAQLLEIALKVIRE